VYCISIKPVLSDHLSYMTIFHWDLGRSHKAGLTVYILLYSIFFRNYWQKRHICIIPCPCWVGWLAIIRKF